MWQFITYTGVKSKNKEKIVPNMSDEELVAASQKGDSGAMESVLLKYRNYVKAKARSFFLVGSEIEDLVQEGMIGLYKAVRDYSGDKNCSFKNFAFLCINRQIFTAIRGANREKHKVLNSSVSLNAPIDINDEENIYIDVIDETVASNPEQALISREINNQLEASIERTLTDDEKQVLKHYLAGLSYNEIAAKLIVTTKVVDNALQRIKKKLQKDINFREN